MTHPPEHPESYGQFLKSKTKLERLYLSRRVCAFCEQPLNRECGSIFGPKCTDVELIIRAERCLAKYKPRKKSP